MTQFLQIDFGKSSERVVGIDLGTTNSLIAYMDLTGPKIILGAGGGKLLPSLVSVSESGEIVVGTAAQKLLVQAEPPQAFQNLVNEVVDSSRD